MRYFTEQNTDGFSHAQLEVLNVAFEEAWGALKGATAADDDSRSSLGDAINNAWVEGITFETLAETALTRMGFSAVRDTDGLKIKH